MPYIEPLFVPPFGLVIIMVILNYVLPLVLSLLLGFFLGKRMNAIRLVISSLIVWLVIFPILLTQTGGRFWMCIVWMGCSQFSFNIYFGILICLGIEVGCLVGISKASQSKLK